MAYSFDRTAKTSSRGKKIKPKRLFDDSDSDYLWEKDDRFHDSSKQDFDLSSLTEGRDRQNLKWKPSTSKHYSKTALHHKKMKPKRLFDSEPSADELNDLMEDIDKKLFEDLADHSRNEFDFNIGIEDRDRYHFKSSPSTSKKYAVKTPSYVQKMKPKRFLDIEASNEFLAFLDKAGIRS